MLLPFIFSLVFALAISGMVFVRVWNIRKGKITAGEEYTVSDIFSFIDWEKASEKCSAFAINKFRKAVATASRLLVNFYHILKKFVEDRVEHFSMSVPPVDGNNGEKGTASFFLKDISEHKDNFRNGDIK
jgi:hypothetical protein